MKQLLAWLLTGLLLAGCGRGSESRVRGDVGLIRPDWRRLEEEARGAEVSLLMYGNSEWVRRYVEEYVAPQVEARYGITIRRVAVSDVGAVVQDLLNERRSAQPRTGVADLLWIDGVAFQRAREGGALFGPWARQLPNARLVEWSQPSIAHDGGAAVGGYGAPWGQSILLALYDTARTSSPPATMAALEEWVKAHPGRFTYPRPPSPEGSAFIRQAFYELTGGYAQWQGPFDEASYAAKAGAVWDYLERIGPFLWREGREYPVSGRKLEDLYVAGEVDIFLSYNPGQVWRQVLDGELPRTTSIYLFEHGALARTHYLAIPFNAPHRAAAMVVANWLLTPEAQAEKAKPDVWGDLPVVEAGRVREVVGAAPCVLPAQATTAADVLRTRRLPEPPPALVERLDSDWARLIPQR